MSEITKTELKETPYLFSGSADFSDELQKKFNINEIKGNEYLGTYHYQDPHTGVFYYYVDFYFLEKELVIYGFDKECTEQFQCPVYTLLFKKDVVLKYPLFKNIDKSIILQSDKGVVLDDLQSTGLTTFLYQLLIRKRFIIVSDNAQYESGAAVWNSLAKKSGKFYKIIVCDVNYGPIDKDSGNVKFYNGSNIQDQELWTSNNNYDGYFIVFVMFSDGYIPYLNV